MDVSCDGFSKTKQSQAKYQIMHIPPGKKKEIALDSGYKMTFHSPIPIDPPLKNPNAKQKQLNEGSIYM